MKRISVILTFLLILLLSACAKNDIHTYIRFVEGDHAKNVRGRIFLTQSLDDTSISWTSDQNDVINIETITNVKINRPLLGQDDKIVQLSATHGNVKKTFTLTVKALTNDPILNEYPSLRSENHIIEYILYDDLLVKLTNKEKSLIYFGFAACSYCQEYLPYFEHIARTSGYEGKIYYFDFLEIRKIETVDGMKKLNDDFQAIIDLIDTQEKKYSVDNNGLPWLYAPTFIGLDDHEIKGLFTGSVGAIEGYHEAHNASQAALNASQKEALESEIRSILNAVNNCEC